MCCAEHSKTSGGETTDIRTCAKGEIQEVGEEIVTQRPLCWVKTRELWWLDFPNQGSECRQLETPDDHDARLERSQAEPKL
jgi:hypothetical protein